MPQQQEFNQKQIQYFQEAVKIIAEGTKRWQRGLDCYRQQCASQIAIFKGVSCGMPIEKITWWSQLAEEETFNSFLNEIKGLMRLQPQAPTYDQDHTRIACASAFSHLKSVEYLNTPCWFSLSKGLLWGLYNTELKETFVEHVRMPFPSFFIALPPKCVYLNDPTTGLHEARYIGVTEGFEPYWGRAIHIAVFCEPNKNSTSLSDDHVMDTWIPLFEDTQPLEKVIDMLDHLSDISLEMIKKRDISRIHEQFTPEEARKILQSAILRTESGKKPQKDNLSSMFGYIFDEKYSDRDLKRVIMRIVANTLLYINSVSAYKKHIHEDEIDQLKAKALKAKKGMAAQRSRLLKHINELSKVSEWTLGTNITIDPMAIIHKKGPSHSSTGRKLSAPSITKGHWRHQAHGPGFSLRKLIWIAPFVRGQELGTPYGHKYEVKP